MATSERKPGKGEQEKTIVHDMGKLPLGPSVQYRVRGQGLGDLPNTDLMPTLEASGKTPKPRAITPKSAVPLPGKKGRSKPLFAVVIGTVIVVVGGVFALSVGNSDTTNTATITATRQQTNPATQATAVQTPVTDTVPAAPSILTQAPILDVAQADAAAMGNVPAIDAFIKITPSGSNTAVLSAVAAQPYPFACDGCRPFIPGLDALTIALYHSPGADGADALDMLGRMNASSIATFDAIVPVSVNQVRFYNVDYLAAAQALAVQYNATLVDLSWYAPAPAKPTVELWLAE